MKKLLIGSTPLQADGIDYVDVLLEELLDDCGAYLYLVSVDRIRRNGAFDGTIVEFIENGDTSKVGLSTWSVGESHRFRPEPPLV